MMIKISELKKLGVEVAVGDVLADGTVVNGDWVDTDTEIKSFAPRKNSGECPVNGDVMVEATLESGEVVHRHAIDFIWKDIDDGGLVMIISWIPSMKHLVGEISDHIASIPFSQKGVVIDRVEAAITTLTGMDYTFNGGTHWKPPLGVNPVFTKAMVDSGELPPIGSECMVMNKTLHSPSWERCTIDFIGAFVVVYSSESCNERVASIAYDNVEFKLMPTERDLTTNDLENIIASQGHLNKANITEQIANLIYDAGYRKSDK